MRLLLSVLVAAAAGCGPSPAARSSRGLADRGDYAGAARVATDDREAAHDLAVAVLGAGLRADAPRVRIAAIRAVERHELEDLAHDVERLLGADDDAVRATAAAALLGSHPDAPALCTELLESETAEARTTCAGAIGRKFGDPRRDLAATFRARARAAVRPLLADRDPAVRRVAIRVIDAIGEAADGPALLALAAREPDPTTRAIALRAVLDRGATLALGRDALGSPDLAIRLAGVAILAVLGAGEIDALVAGPDLQLAIHAAAARYAASGASGRDALERALAAPAWPVRAAALNLAAQAAPRAELVALAGRAIVDPRAEVRLAAAALLVQLGQRERASAELRAQVGAGASLDLRVDAAAQLGRLGDEVGLDALSRMAGGGDAAARRAAIAAHATARRVTRGLVLAMAAADPLDRIAAADLVLELGR